MAKEPGSKPIEVWAKVRVWTPPRRSAASGSRSLLHSRTHGEQLRKVLKMKHWDKQLSWKLSWGGIEVPGCSDPE